jgi:hypothetical protein
MVNDAVRVINQQNTMTFPFSFYGSIFSVGPVMELTNATSLTDALNSGLQNRASDKLDRLNGLYPFG